MSSEDLALPPIVKADHDIIDDAEDYAVYSAALAHAKGTGIGKDIPDRGLVVFNEASFSTSCPAQFRQSPEWEETVSRLKNTNLRAAYLKPGFNLGTPYSIVSIEELRAHAPDNLIRLSPVGFNRARNRAIVSILHQCRFARAVGTNSDHLFCNNHNIVYLEKRERRWTAITGCAGIQ